MLNYGNIELEGPFATLDALRDSPGLYALFCFEEETGSFELLQVQTSSLVQSAVLETLQEQWSDICPGKLRVGVLYSDDTQQLQQVKEQILWAK